MSETWEREREDALATAGGAEDAEGSKEQELTSVEDAALEGTAGQRRSLFDEQPTIDAELQAKLGLQPDGILDQELAPSLDDRLDPLGLGVEDAVGGLPGELGDGLLPDKGLNMDLPGGVGQPVPTATGAHQADPTVGFVTETAVNVGVFAAAKTMAESPTARAVINEARDVAGAYVESVGKQVSAVGAMVTDVGEAISPSAPAQASGATKAATEPIYGPKTEAEQAAADKAAGPTKAAAPASPAGTKSTESTAAAEPTKAAAPTVDPEDAEETITNPDADGGPIFSPAEAVATAALKGGFAKTPTTGVDGSDNTSTDSDGDAVFVNQRGGFTDPLEEQVDVALFQPEIRDDFNDAGPEFGPDDDGVNTAGSIDLDG